MSIQAMTWAFEQELPSTDKFVLVACANYADADGYGFAGQRRLAAMVGCSDRTVRSALARLEAAHYLRREQRRREDGSFTSDAYWIDLSRPHDLVPSGKSRRRQTTTDPAETDDTSSGKIFRTIRTFGSLEPSEEPSVEPSALFDMSTNEAPVEPISVADLIAPVEEHPYRPDTFEDFWAAWPRKESRKAALAAWVKAARRADAADIVEYACAYAASPWRPARQFVPYGATFLNGDCWTDPLPQPPEPDRTAKPDKDQQAFNVLEMGRQLQAEHDRKAIRS